MTDISPVPVVTIIVPTLDRPTVAQSTIAQLLSQRFGNFEAWMIDQSGSIDAEANRTFMESLNDTRFHYLYSDVRNLPNARNEGLARARGEIVLFLDDDVIILTDDFIDAHVRAFDDPKVGGVVGRHVERTLTMNVPYTACHVSWTGRTIFNLFGHARTEVGSCKGSNMSFRMSAVREIGGFDRRTSLLEETDFSTRIRRAGWKLLFEPAAELVHLSTPSGGVRSPNVLATEEGRFASTAYFILKHRGVLGTVPFVATFLMIAIKKAIALRSPGAIVKLVRAMSRGFGEARKTPQDWMPATIHTVP